MSSARPYSIRCTFVQRPYRIRSTDVEHPLELGRKKTAEAQGLGGIGLDNLD